MFKEEIQIKMKAKRYSINYELIERKQRKSSLSVSIKKINNDFLREQAKEKGLTNSQIIDFLIDNLRKKIK